ncbi:MAG: hypothetical protein V4658_04300, partial [Bacteroidota bacterium]
MQAQLTQHIIWNSIKELLHRHDCVIVPDFGGFVCNREQSRIDQVSHIITPPAKRIVFNQNLRTNDGLLAQRISEKLTITYTEALRSIAELVNQLRAHLEQIKQLDIEAFGSFRLNADANYVFLPDRMNNYLYSSFGLMPLQTIPVGGYHKGTRQTRIFKDRKEVREARRMVRAKHAGLKMLTAALVIMLLLNGYIFLTDANLIGGAKINTTGINSWFDSLMKRNEPVAEKHQPIVQPQQNEVIPPPPVADLDTAVLNIDTPDTAPAIDESHALNLAEVFAGMNKTAPLYNYSSNDELIATEEPALVETPVIPIPVETPVNNSAITKGKFSYHVIGGVFCKEKNARKFYNKLREQGFDAELLLNTRINCNRVSYRKLDNMQEAIQLMDSLK